MRRSVVLATLVSCGLALGAALAASPASADQTVVVPGLSFPPGDTYVTTFGCADLYHGADATPLVRLGNLDASPAGRRSAGVLPPSAGSATGPVTRVASVAATSVEGFTARADRGGSGSRLGLVRRTRDSTRARSGSVAPTSTPRPAGRTSTPPARRTTGRRSTR